MRCDFVSFYHRAGHDPPLRSAIDPRKHPVGQGHAPAVGKPLTCGAISTVRTGGRPMVAPTMGVGRLHNHLPLPVGEVARR